MAQTKSEKLIDQDGKPALCDICHRKLIFVRGQWMMTLEKDVVCPECRETVLKTGKGLVTI